MEKKAMNYPVHQMKLYSVTVMTEVVMAKGVVKARKEAKRVKARKEARRAKAKKVEEMLM